MTRISGHDLERARARIENFVHRTPILTSRLLDERCGCRVFLKCENFQRGGAFKIRGAMNFVLGLSPDELARGIVTHSSGNHAQAVALAAREASVTAYVVMPEDAPAIKRAASADYGARLTLCGSSMAAREEAARAIVASTGALLLHPYDDDRVIAGQATAAMELLQDVPDLDFILAPVSGGGLLSGTALAASHHGSSARIVGCEPALAADAHKSMQLGKLVIQPAGPTVADGLRANLCERTFAIIHSLVDEIVILTEEEILAAMRFLWERVKIVVEPSGAASLAPLLFHSIRFSGKRIGVIVSGGNVDLGVVS